MRIALGLEYNGSGFCGWQSQAGGGAVQDCLERALCDMAGHKLRVIAAGRTDAGVHALCQVVHFDTSTVRPLSAWVRGINAHLPASLRVLWAQPVDEAFHARFSAERRSYQYLLLNRPVAPAVMHGIGIERQMKPAGTTMHDRRRHGSVQQQILVAASLG